ncbi:TetR/AcrR family transcriptional regulator [Micromonospora sp. NBC_00362]|uniref:TetR/AcrR family transcriptional regulator C-terminal domain-containing protein n=1 Tax=unclassified Micromonospora TaxID=2617518 RepID=UPI00225A2EBC|nr:TetR/AcrR family transcriptional regulator C-terminal domain-containing protein [Micromonospora sp. NBC_00362]MCX5119659.1 TetR/AcrR family transcriptional regulator [Micromonospora sp. NBC_00362]WTI08307.1 TetR/AcrR family transcriptional regulator [Micromonospora sp. NBC_00821]
MTSDDFVPAPLRRLWGMSESSRLGRPPSLDVNVVVAAAVKIADRDGLDGVTLPKVATSLGFTSMSLYRHVGSKDELLTLMADAALGPPPNIDAPEWRGGLRRWAFAHRAVLQRRPWLTRVPVAGPPSGPHQIAWMEAALAIMSDTLLDWAHKIGAMSLISGYVVQSVRQHSELADGRAEGQGQADAERDYGRALARLVNPDRFPETARLFASTLFEAPPSDTPDEAIADADFSLGLELILDGVAVRVARSDP